MKIVCILFMVGVLCLKTSTANSIQIVAPVDHRFQLKADVLKPILDKENIKDRNVVVISIAGAFRQGKSFLMNFFIKYLYAQVSKSSSTHLEFENFLIYIRRFTLKFMDFHQTSMNPTILPTGLVNIQVTAGWMDSNGELVASEKH